MLPIDLKDSKEDLVESIPPDLDFESRFVLESKSNLTPIPTRKELVATQSTERVQPVSRLKQVTSKRPEGDKGGPSKKPKK